MTAPQSDMAGDTPVRAACREMTRQTIAEMAAGGATVPDIVAALTSAALGLMVAACGKAEAGLWFADVCSRFADDIERGAKPTS